MASSSSMQARSHCMFEEWMSLQQSELDELLAAMPTSTTTPPTGAGLEALISRCMRHFEDYAARRRSLAEEDSPPFFSPSWCTTFEAPFLWLAGCRPSLAIRLLYSLTASHQDDNDNDNENENDLLAALNFSGSSISALSPDQVLRVNELHRKTLSDENRLTTRMATLQEDIADTPLLPIVMRGDSGATARRNVSNGVGNAGELGAALDGYAESLARMMAEADELRVRTVKELVTEVLTPAQAVELLAAAKRLHLSVHEWGRRRDLQRRR